MIYILPTDTCFGIGCGINDLESYKRIYEIKGRNFNKPLAIMLLDINFLSNFLNEKQIVFLKSYKRPWTILVDFNLKKPLNNLYFNQFTLFILNKLPNFDLYKKLAFRVSNNEIESRLIKEIGPIFLTSANISGKAENYKLSDLKKDFSIYLDEINIITNKDLEKEVFPSDIFEFIGDTLDINFIRKY